MKMSWHFLSTNSTARSKQLARFGLVGMVTTSGDLALFNLLSAAPFGLSLLAAHWIASAVTLTTSFWGHRHWVFTGPHQPWIRQAIRFLGVTVTGLSLVQGTALTHAAWFLTHVHDHWTWGSSLSPKSWTLLHRNGAKSAAMFAGISWNYLWFRCWVFRDSVNRM